MDADWEDKLAHVERSIGDCLAALDRYEAAFQHVVASTAESPAPRSFAMPPWPERTVSGAIDEVDQILADQESLWRRWQTAFAGWQAAATPR